MKPSFLADVAKGSVPPVAVPAAERLAFFKAFARKAGKLDLAQLSIGDLRVLHMPGELFCRIPVGSQADAPQAQRGDGGLRRTTGHSTSAPSGAYSEGGYETEPRSSNVAPEVESVMMQAIRKLLSGN
ncbi:MAG: hypothetical protein CM1200mP29_06280 [Verrucomicrobiota bacterium]|nr:MAG: hypothetical protein CM1200mP29_06280 [Verrucomicrobiota bacterium]